MAVGLSPATANSILNHMRGSTPWVQPAGMFVKLHTGDPGVAGTTAAAGNTVRQQATFGGPAGGSMANTSAIAWTNVSTAETYSHVSVWDAATGGNFLWSGTLAVPRAVTVGADFQIKIGEITAAFGVAA